MEISKRYPKREQFVQGEIFTNKSWQDWISDNFDTAKFDSFKGIGFPALYSELMSHIWNNDCVYVNKMTNVL